MAPDRVEALEAEVEQAYAAWKVARDEAERAWAKRREEIQAEEVVDPVHQDDVTKFSRAVQAKTQTRAVEVRALQRERDAVIARAQAEFQKKRDALDRDLKLHREALKKARDALAAAERARDTEIRSRYREERAPYFEKADALRERLTALERQLQQARQGGE